MADPMTPEALAEILWTARSRAKGIADPSPLPTMPAYTRERYRRFAVEVAKLVDLDAARAEVERLRAELADTVHALTVTGEKLTAVRGQRDRSEAARDDAFTVLRDALTAKPASLAGAASAAAKVIRIRTAERDEARAELAAAHDELTRARLMLSDAQDERDEAREQVKRVKQVRTWRNEDGRKFVFADDLHAALGGPETAAPDPTDPA